MPAVQARKIKTRHSIPKESVASVKEEPGNQKLTISLESDSIRFCGSIVPAIRFYGFDKTVTSNQESFFITNGLDEAISGMEVVITYTDLKGRQLHRRTVSLDCHIPARETKRVDTKSWDTQKSFYYNKSVKPRRQATPFDVRLELLSVTLY